MGLFKKITSNPLRSLAAVGTLGGSELALGAGKKLGLGLEDEQGAFATPEQTQQGLYRNFANDYERQTETADAGVRNSQLTKGVYGEGGLQAQLGQEGRQLADTGFQLTQGDREAYGQASGDVARLFGQQEQQASQSLARRGLASASSGAAGAAFSGLAGNKNEMLAKAQTDIASKRMADTQNRLQQNRQMQQQMAVQGSQMANQRFSDKGQGLLNAVKVEGDGNQEKRTALADQQAAVRPGLFSTIGQGLQAGIGSLATQGPGMLMTGGMSGMGAKAGGLFGGGSGVQLGTSGLKADKAGGTTGYSRAYMDQ